MLRNILLILLFSALQLLAVNPFALQNGQQYLKLSPDGQWLTFDKAEQPGLYLVNLKNGASIKIASGFGIAQFAQWAPNSDYIGFKMFAQSNNEVWQIPCLFDIARQKIIPLHQPVPLAGVPALDSHNHVFFAVGSTVYETDVNGTIRETFNLPDYANLTPVSRNGRWLVYNNAQDRLFLLDLQSGMQKSLNLTEGNYFNPLWNPHESILAVQTFSGKIQILDILTNRVIFETSGTEPAWSANGNKLLFAKKTIIETQSVENSDLFSFDLSNASLVQLTKTPEVFEDFPALSPRNVIYFTMHTKKSEGIFSRSILNSENNKANFSATAHKLKITRQSEIFGPRFSNLPQSLRKTTAYSFDIPYVHQCFDSPEWFNGCTACGGTAAIMCIAYYHILPERPRKVYDPFYHITKYGDYIAEKYTYNGFTFDIWAYDRDGVKGYGAFGFIVRHGSEAWADTKGFMAEFARKHGLYSYVDWGPTREKLMVEANAKRPFVLLNSITSSGHYISVIGYDKNATTVIVNDPAGDKSMGSYGANYGGKGARYDWPGYSNGHPNLNRVWCFIYFRDKCADLAVQINQTPDTLRFDSLLTLKGQISNIGNNPSDSANAYLFLSQNQSFDAQNDWILDTLRLAGLNPSDTVYINRQIELHDSLISSFYYLGIHVETTNRPNEAYLSNNTALHKVAVKGFPNIYRVLPRGEIQDSLPQIKGYFTDMFSAIDLQSVRMILDSTDVTDSLVLSNTSAIFHTQNKLNPGVHSVKLFVKNSLGLQSVAQWQFTIAQPTLLAGIVNRPPQHLQLNVNYPNPFNNRTRIQFYLPKSGWVKADLFNIQGQKVRTLLHSNLSAGSHFLLIDGTHLASGIYLLRLQSGKEMRVRRLLLLK